MKKPCPISQINSELLKEICAGFAVATAKSWRDPFDQRPYRDARHSGSLLMVSDEHRDRLKALRDAAGIVPDRTHASGMMLTGRLPNDTKNTTLSVPVHEDDQIVTSAGEKLRDFNQSVGFNSASYVVRLDGDRLSVMDNTLCFSRQVGTLVDADIDQIYLAIINAHLKQQNRPALESLPDISNPADAEADHALGAPRP